MAFIAANQFQYIPFGDCLILGKGASPGVEQLYDAEAGLKDRCLTSDPIDLGQK